MWLFHFRSSIFVHCITELFTILPDFWWYQRWNRDYSSQQESAFKSHRYSKLILRVYWTLFYVLRSIIPLLYLLGCMKNKTLPLTINPWYLNIPDIIFMQIDPFCSLYFHDVYNMWCTVLYVLLSKKFYISMHFFFMLWKLILHTFHAYSYSFYFFDRPTLFFWQMLTICVEEYNHLSSLRFICYHINNVFFFTEIADTI